MKRHKFIGPPGRLSTRFVGVTLRQNCSSLLGRQSMALLLAGKGVPQRDTFGLSRAGENWDEFRGSGARIGCDIVVVGLRA